MRAVVAFHKIYGMRLLPRGDVLSVTSVMTVCCEWREIVAGHRKTVRRLLSKQVILSVRGNEFCYAKFGSVWTVLFYIALTNEECERWIFCHVKGFVACLLLLTSLSFTLYLILSFRSTIDQTLTVCDRTRQGNGSQTSSSREGQTFYV
jgi:hypothetical protein